MPSSVITFSRKNRNRGADSGSEASSAASTYVTAPSVLTPVAESPGSVDQDENAGFFAPSSTAKTGDSSVGKAGGGGRVGAAVNRWRRKNAAERQEAERRQALSEMRAYFEEVDAFELAVETPPGPKAARPADGDSPSPLHPAAAGAGGAAGRNGTRHQQGAGGGGVARALAAAAPTPGTAARQRPMSLGLSRRRSSMAVAWPLGPAAAMGHLASSSTSAAAAGNQSPLRLSIPAAAMQERQQDAAPFSRRPSASTRTSLLPAGPHRLSVAADNAGLVPGGSPGWAANRRSLAARAAAARRSSVAPSRLSGTGQMLSRLSLGLTDALQWLGLKGKIPTTTTTTTTTAGPAGGEEQQQAVASGAAAAAAGQAPAVALLERPALSPIASPGGEEGEEEAAESPAVAGSPLAATERQTQQQEEALAGDAAGASTPEPAGEQAEAAAAVAASPLVPAAAADVEAWEGGQLEEGAAKEEQEDEAADVEQLEQQLAAKLQLEEQAAEADEQDEEQQGAVAAEAQGAAEQAAAAAEAAAEAEATPAAEDLTPLQQLLLLCGQEPDPCRLPSMDELLGQHVDLKKVRKIGEGTFGEAFKAGGVVLKIVPMEGQVLVNGEHQKRADEILAEVAITLTLSRLNGSGVPPDKAPPANLAPGFVETYGVGVCCGAYSGALAQEWHRWDEEHGSENEPVDVFDDQPQQLFVVFVVADGGCDLEHFELRCFQEVRAILLQAVLTVAVGEEACQFEHRDLHWGNLLIRRSNSSSNGRNSSADAGAGAGGSSGEEGGAASAASVRARLRGVELEAMTSGVTVTLIDFTLSRLVTVTGEVAYCDLAADPELFKGPKGNVQADTYRRMKKATRNRWEAHCPSTNLFWMQYLVDICLTEKKGWGCGREELAQLRAFKRRIANYSCCADLLFDDFLRPCLMVHEA